MSFVLVALLLIGILALTFHTHLSNASGTIYIRADGSIEPSYANIVTTDNITYSFTGNNYDAIWVERSNIVIDGNGYTLQRIGGSGFYIVNVNNITIKNTNIDGCDIYFLWSSNNSILANNLTNGGGITLSSSSNNNISGNMITNCSKGIDLTLQL